MELAPEVQGAIVGGAIGIFSASVTALANHVNLEKRLRSKNERRLAEFFLDKKVDALATVHAELTACYATLGEALANPSAYSWDRVRSEVHPAIDAFEEAITVGDVYLTAAQEAALRETAEKYRSVADKVAILENGRRDMIDDVYDATERAGGALAEEINEPIRRLEGEEAAAAEDREEAGARRREAPTAEDASNWATLATQRDRLREYVRVTDDGGTEFLVDVAPPGRALLTVIGRRYAYERDLVESPTVAEDELRSVLGGSREDVESFASEAEAHLMSDDGEYAVEVEDIEAGIDWAAGFVRADGTAADDEA